MKNRNAIALIENFLDREELDKVKKVCISFKKTPYPLFAKLFRRNTKNYFLRITYKDKSERFIRIESSQKEQVKQSIKAFNSNINTYNPAI